MLSRRRETAAGRMLSRRRETAAGRSDLFWDLRFLGFLAIGLFLGVLG
jgi:hypothetical protein